ncbi:MAG: type I secretion system permease/ATPase [Halomonadaceae bacterium]|nr:MAG: type I secretion system permease/ATPase [Halomonadaceae bacterium]
MNSHYDPLLECLRIIGRQYQQTSTPEHITNGLPLDKGRLSPATLERAAARIGMSCKQSKSSLLTLNEALFPVILLLKEEKACVLVGFDSDNAPQVIYPELPDATTTVPLEGLAAQYSGYMVYCKPKYTANKRASLTGSPESGHWFWSTWSKCRGLYRDVITASLLINVLALGMPLFIMNVYDRVVPNHSTSTLWVLATGLTIVLIADFSLKMMRTWFVDLASLRTDVEVSSRIMSRVLGLSLASKPASTGAFANSIQSFESVRGFTSSLTILALVDLPFSLLFIAIIAWIGLPLILPILIGAALLLIYAASIQRQLKAMADATMKASAHKNAVVVEAINNLETVKSFNGEGHIQSDFEASSLEVSRQNAAMRLLSGTVTQGATFVQHTVAVAIIVIGVYLLIDGQLSQGGLIAAYLLSSRVMAPISQTAGLLAQYHNAATAMETLDTVMDLPQERPEGKEWLSRANLTGKIEFRNVSFRYPDDERYALHNASFVLQPGEHVVVLGKNGSGKTTLQRLLLGLYQPESGAVLFDGVDIRQLDPAFIRRQIGYVPQDVHLMHGSLKHNVLLGDPSASDERLLKASQLSGMDALASKHPAGFDLVIGENGQGLSGGQRQTVAITRALVNDPMIMILDEPTESLDHSAEASLCHSLKRVGENRTMVMITHRSLLMELASRIIVIDNGQIVADGPKQEVIEALRSGRISGGKA